MEFENYFTVTNYYLTPYHDYIIENNINSVKIQSYQLQESLSVLPDCIQHIIISYSCLPDFNFPKNLESLHIIECVGYDLEIFNHLPTTLKNLSIHDENFNESLNYLPLGLKYLEVPWNYNMSLDYLPSSLEILVIPKNYPIPSNLPAYTKIKRN